MIKKLTVINFKTLLLFPIKSEKNNLISFKISQNQLKYFHLLSVIMFCFYHHSSVANNSIYINLSNYVAKNVELETVSNNIANQNTIAFEEDNIISSTYSKQTGKNSKNLFVAPKSRFASKTLGGVLYTGRELDLLIQGDGYFKVRTPQGFRYTLDGNIQINQNGVLITKSGYSYLDEANQEITIPIGTKIYINENGVIFSNEEEVGKIGVFTVANKTFLIKEGQNLYSSKINDIIIEESSILSGALRKSNTDSYKNMANMMEINNSLKATNNLMHDSLNLEKKAIERITK
jgi:hypothetical protein